MQHASLGRRHKSEFNFAGRIPLSIGTEKAPDFIERLTRKIPMGRIGKAEEVCGSVIFLASMASSYVNGANIAVDGGWTSW